MKEGGAALGKVLVVEDDLDIQKVVLMSLKMRGVKEIVAVDGGEECLARLANYTPDVILLDVMMPHLDGYETCRRLKENPATRAIPVIFLTARVQKAERERGLRLGAAGYLIKPFDPMVLFDEIVSIVSGEGRKE
jgi:CheY-like chemotaxis protein